MLFNADRWDGATAWHHRFREFVAETDAVIFGAQLPVSSPYGDRFHPLLYPSTIEQFLPKAPAATYDIDLIFLGDYADESDPSEYPEPLVSGADVNWRSRQARAHSLDILRRGLSHRRLLIECRSFWEFRSGAHPVDIARLIVSYRRELMRALVGFSPPGKGSAPRWRGPAAWRPC